VVLLAVFRAALFALIVPSGAGSLFLLLRLPALRDHQVTLNGRSFQVVGVAVTAAASYTDVCFGDPVCSFFIGSGTDLVRQGPPAEPPDGQTVTVDVGPPPDDAGLVWTHPDGRPRSRPCRGGPVLRLELEAGRPGRSPRVRRRATGRRPLALAPGPERSGSFESRGRRAAQRPRGRCPCSRP
jgi:hypothetical protein